MLHINMSDVPKAQMESNIYVSHNYPFTGPVYPQLEYLCWSVASFDGHRPGHPPELS